VRYRPFGATGKAVSAVSLLLRDGPSMNAPSAWRGLVFAAMENGVNSFELAGGSDILAIGVGEALAAVERRLIFLAYRLRTPLGSVSAHDVANAVRAVLQRTRAGYLDLLMLDETTIEALTPQARGYLADLKSSGVCLQIGVAGDGPAIEGCISDPVFDVLTLPFTLTSDWQARRRIREASAANMTLIGCDPFSADIKGGQKTELAMGDRKRGLLSIRRPQAAAGPDAYAFLRETPGWTFEELCLGYVLTEPAFSTIQLELWRADALERMAAVADRDLPTGVAAQIEMARFGRVRAEGQA
jgi:aryl-alcohol dehydrogenase-like predicted oxidoreductase